MFKNLNIHGYIILTISYIIFVDFTSSGDFLRSTLIGSIAGLSAFSLWVVLMFWIFPKTLNRQDKD